MTVATSEDIAFIDRILESWAAWARQDGCPRCSHPISYASARSVSHVLRLGDESFSVVDSAVAKLTLERRNVIKIHYCRPEHETRGRKAQVCGISITGYNRLVRNAQLDVYEALVARVDSWRMS